MAFGEKGGRTGPEERGRAGKKRKKVALRISASSVRRKAHSEPGAVEETLVWQKKKFIVS